MSGPCGRSRLKRKQPAASVAPSADTVVAEPAVSSRVALGGAEAVAEAPRRSLASGSRTAPREGDAAVGRGEAGGKRGRQNFTPAEDAALKDWVREHASLAPQGQTLWKMAERARVTRHSWQSMQNHYRRQLMVKRSAAAAGRRSFRHAVTCNRDAVAGAVPVPENGAPCQMPRARPAAAPTASAATTGTSAELPAPAGARAGSLAELPMSARQRPFRPSLLQHALERTRHRLLQQTLERTRDRDAATAANAVPVAGDSALCQMPRARAAAAPAATTGTSAELPGPADARADSWVALQVQEEMAALQLPAWLRRADADAKLLVDWGDV